MQEYAFSVHGIPVGILGASGYAGRELCALVAAEKARENSRKTPAARAALVDIGDPLLKGSCSDSIPPVRRAFMTEAHQFKSNFNRSTHDDTPPIDEGWA